MPQPATLPRPLACSRDSAPRLLRAARTCNAPGSFALFLAQVGSEYRNELLVVGRATNGWGAEGCQFTLAEIRDDAAMRARIESTLADTAADVDPNQCLEERESASPFSRIARDVARAVGINDNAWYRRIAWSNLYKVAPAEDGNPPEELMDGQLLAESRSLLRAELMELAPRSVLFLVGCGARGGDWFQWFESAIDFQLTGSSDIGTDHAKWGRVVGGATAVVLPRPEMRSTAALTDAAVRALLGPAASG